jgi:small ligand-binding sensory domain FIST
MTPSRIESATGHLEDVNQLLMTAISFVPIFGGLLASIVAIARRHKNADPALVKTLQDGVARMTSELDALAANDAAWRVEHPEGG